LDTEEPLKVTEYDVPLHIAVSSIAATLGVGLTVIVKLFDTPLQLFAVGVTVTVAVFIELVAFVAIKGTITPELPDARPIVLSLFVQLYAVPTTGLPLNIIAAVLVLLHTVWLDTLFTLGVGSMVILKLCDAPLQPFADGVTVIVAVLMELVAFVAIKDAILPVLPDPSPIVLSLLVQLYAVPATKLPLNVIAAVFVLLHTVWLDTEDTEGNSFIVTLTVAVTEFTPLLTCIVNASVPKSLLVGV